LNLIRDDEGKPYEIMGISRDITARKKAELKIIESEKLYRKAYKQANFYKDLFVHDISNIFNALYGYSQLYSEYQEEMEGLYEQEEIMKNFNRHVYRGVNLIRDVQKLSSLDNSNIPTKSVNACEVLKDAIEHTVNSFPKKEIKVDFDYSSKDNIVEANELLLDVFENIVNNAIKYNTNTPIEILIKIAKEQMEEKKFVKFEFLDNGIGIMDELKQYTFKKGYKIEMKSKGMGFGLSIVKKIIKSYNGQIWVENKVEGDYTQGSNFVLLIPESS
jgi:signal transduction histidine kinase